MKKLTLEDFERNLISKDYKDMDNDARQSIYTLSMVYSCDVSEGIYNVKTDEYDTINEFFQRRTEESGADDFLEYLDKLFNYVTITRFIEEKAKIPLLEKIQSKLMGELKK